MISYYNFMRTAYLLLTQTYSILKNTCVYVILFTRELEVINEKCKIPEATINRLSIYSRFLELEELNGVVTVSSNEIAKKIGITPAQVRRDLAYFGEFGTRGVGYNVKDLKENIMRILGLHKRWNIALIGAGNLGRALINYKGFSERGFDIVAVFDNNPNKIGKIIRDKKILDIKRDLEKLLKSLILI